MPDGLRALVERADSAERQMPPVDLWDPPSCGAIDIRIGRDGGWSYLGTPILRERLVHLFASVLRREPDGTYVLVTPVEKLTITVEDVPFLAVEMAVSGKGSVQNLTFRTNVGDLVEAGPDRPLRFAVTPGRGDFLPYVLVRGGLEARLSRPLTHDLVELLDEREGVTGIVSGGAFFPIPEAALSEGRR